MKLDLYTKAVLTVIALLLAVIAAKPLISPETASAQGAFAGVQFSTYVAGGNRTYAFFDSRTGEAWFYDGGDLKPNIQVRLTRLGDTLVQSNKR